MALKSKVLLLALIALSLAVSGYEALLFALGRNVAGPFQETWSLVFIVLLVLWIDADCRERKSLYRPFEFGFLVFMFWLPYLPYYLVRTRHAKGLLWLLGFVLLFWLGYLLQWVIYVAR